MKRSFEKLPKRQSLADEETTDNKRSVKVKQIAAETKCVDSKSLKKIVSLLTLDEDAAAIKRRKVTSLTSADVGQSNPVIISDNDDSSNDSADEEAVDNFALQSELPSSDVTLEADDGRALQLFLTGEIKNISGDVSNDQDAERSDLAEILKERITEQRTELESQLSDPCPSIGDIENMEDLPEELKQHVLLLKDLLRQYRSGKLPKTLKMLPQLNNWEAMLDMLEPTDWTAAAVRTMTKHFAAKGKIQAMHFYSTVLMPRIRDDIQFYKRLNSHLSQALVSAIFRPREFFVAILIPMCKDELTLSEATVLSGLLRRVSIPVRYASVGLAQVAGLPFSVPRTVIIQALLDKKYKLPCLAVKYTIKFFTSLDREEDVPFADSGRLPVVWFQSLLTFVQLYKDSLDPDERAAISSLSRRHFHPGITPEIRKLLVIAQSTASST